MASLLLFTINEKDKLEAASGNWSSYTTTISKGKGTYSNPYLIESAGNLAYMINNHKDAYYKQVADIDLTAHYWTPIGNSSKNFLSNYDGNGFIIKNITFSGYTYNYAGLFGYTYMSTLENITLFLIWTCAWSNALKNDHLNMSEDTLLNVSEVEGGFDSKESTTNCKNYSGLTSIPSGFSTSIWGINNSAINNGEIYLKNLYW